MPTQQAPVTRSSDTTSTQSAVRSGPPLPTRLQLPGGYYDPDSACFDELRPRDHDALLKTTVPVAAPALARSRS
jgi:hypothetical protein